VNLEKTYAMWGEGGRLLESTSDTHCGPLLGKNVEEVVTPPRKVPSEKGRDQRVSKVVDLVLALL